MPRLLVNPGTPQQWEIVLKPGLNTLGRNPACDFRIEEGSISGTHCQIAVNGDAVVVKDLGSTNGTFIERAPVRESSLAAGQHLRLGSVDMQLLPDTPAAPAAPAAPAPIRLSVAAPSVAPVAPAAGPPATPGPPQPPSAAGKPGLRLSVAAHAAPAEAPSAGAAVHQSPVMQPLAEDDEQNWGAGGKGDTWKWWYYVLAGVCFAGYDIYRTIDTGRLKHLGGLFLAVLLIAVGVWDFQRKRKRRRGG